jgi:hypothetical protein
MRRGPVQIQLWHATRVKSAEYWLELGLPMQALIELQELPAEALRHPWACAVLRNAFRAGHGLVAQAAEPVPAFTDGPVVVELPRPDTVEKQTAAKQGGRPR